MDCSTTAAFTRTGRDSFQWLSGCLTAALRPLTTDTPPASWSRNNPSVVLVERLRLPTGEFSGFMPPNLRMSSHFAAATSVPKLTAPRQRSNHKSSVAHPLFAPPHCTGGMVCLQDNVSVRCVGLEAIQFQRFILQNASFLLFTGARFPKKDGRALRTWTTLRFGSLTAAHLLGRLEVRTSRDRDSSKLYIYGA